MARFDYFDIVLGISGVMRRLAKVKFADDGSIYVFFPGFVSSEGVLCRAKLLAGTSYPTNLDLSDGGRVTSHLVKYAHHPDGEAHFSQDGKIKTEVRRKSVPLADQVGHLFTIQAQDFASFPPLSSVRKKQVTFNLPNDASAIKLTAWRFPLSGLTRPEETVEGAGPMVGVQTSDGVDRVGLFVLPPEGMPFDDVVLFLSVEITPLLSADKASHLMFMGAFDHPSVAVNHAADTEFIAFAYPCSDFAALKESIGSIDFVAATAKPV